VNPSLTSTPTLEQPLLSTLAYRQYSTMYVRWLQVEILAVGAKKAPLEGLLFDRLETLCSDAIVLLHLRLVERDLARIRLVSVILEAKVPTPPTPTHLGSRRDASPSAN
jgi:hypothetical protein